MKEQVVFLFPGQGSQYPEMGKDFFDEYQVAKDTFLEADEHLSFSLSKLIFEGSKEELALTKNSQVAIYVMSMALYRTFNSLFPLTAVGCGGLSLGEYTALTAAGYIDYLDCLDLVKHRGIFMHEASLNHPGTMAAVMGLSQEEITKVLEPYSIWIANLNCPGQVVIAGRLEQMPKAIEELKSAGAKRALPLDVSGAFHTPLMEDAKEQLAPMINKANMRVSNTKLAMNVPGTIVGTLEEVRSNLISQVANPTRWESCIKSLQGLLPTHFIEVGCGKSLVGMNRKIGVDVPTLSVGKIEDLDTIANTVAKIEV